MYGYQTRAGKQLGNTLPGDGWKYAGAGDIQLTGKGNAQKYGDAFGVDFVGEPDLRLDPDLSARVFAKFWTDHGVPEAIAAGNLKLAREKVNGGDNGLPRFLQITSDLLG